MKKYLITPRNSAKGIKLSFKDRAAAVKYARTLGKNLSVICVD
jgi:hypothetical protein